MLQWRSAFLLYTCLFVGEELAPLVAPNITAPTTLAKAPLSLAQHRFLGAPRKRGAVTATKSFSLSPNCSTQLSFTFFKHTRAVTEGIVFP